MTFRGPWYGYVTAVSSHFASRVRSSAFTGIAVLSVRPSARCPAWGSFGAVPTCSRKTSEISARRVYFAM